MTVSKQKAQNEIFKILSETNINALVDKLHPLSPEIKKLPEQVPHIRSWTQESWNSRLQCLQKELQVEMPFLSQKDRFNKPEILKGNIENYIGMTQVPTGIIGPVRINGSHAKGDFYVPLSTSEGALVASYHRGALAASSSGGITSLCLSEGVQRTPSFQFHSISDVGQFVVWVLQQEEKFKDIVRQNTSHGKLDDVKPNINGNQITLVFEFTTGDASGQNMVTICTYAICEYIVANSPVKPTTWIVEGNMSGDKKASASSLLSVRGKKVTAEAVIHGNVVEEILRNKPQDILKAWNMVVTNGMSTATFGVNCHFANGLTAIFLACGQDVATIAEASVGTTRLDLTQEGHLYITVTLPNLIVGTVGGGTSLPTQKECLSILGCYGNGQAKKFAEVCAATVLCGELSIIASITAGDFARAHKLFGRKRK